MDTISKTADGSKVITKKKYVPTQDDWKLSGFNVEDASNGIVVSCSKKLTDEAREKMRESENYGSEWREPEKYVFEKPADAKAFVIEELNKLWKD